MRADEQLGLLYYKGLYFIVACVVAFRSSRKTRACQYPTLLSCSRHLLACFITEQSTVSPFYLLVNPPGWDASPS